MAGTISVEVYLFPVRWNQNEKEKIQMETLKTIQNYSIEDMSKEHIKILKNN